MATLSALAATQPRLVSVLSAAVASRRLHHAYLIVGADEQAAGDLSRAVAAALLCSQPNGADACGACSACRKVAGGNHPDFITIEANDKGTIGVAEVREASARVALKAAEADIKVVLMTGADRATPQAQNALLKTLEEPPGRTCFLLTAARLRVLLPTVRSRCATLRVTPRDRLSAWRELEAAGVPAPLAQVLGPIIGASDERGRALVDLGAAQMLAALDEALAPGSELGRVLATAADLGQNRERADLALSLLEVRIRDALAVRFGVPKAMLYGEHAQGISSDTRHLARAARRLTSLRRLTALHLNRTLALEAVLRDLDAGAGDGT
jgi:DNA polymerase III subunit delta'